MIPPMLKFSWCATGLVIDEEHCMAGFNREQMARTELGNFPTGEAQPITSHPVISRLNMINIAPHKPTQRPTLLCIMTGSDFHLRN